MKYPLPHSLIPHVDSIPASPFNVQKSTNVPKNMLRLRRTFPHPPETSQTFPDLWESRKKVFPLADLND